MNLVLHMYKCETCGAPTRPNVDGDIRYDAMKPLRTIERLELENRHLRDVLEWCENNCPSECKGKAALALKGEFVSQIGSAPGIKDEILSALMDWRDNLVAVRNIQYGPNHFNVMRADEIIKMVRGDWQPIVLCPTNNSAWALRTEDGSEFTGRFGAVQKRWQHRTGPEEYQDGNGNTIERTIWSNLPEGVFPCQFKPI